MSGVRTRDVERSRTRRAGSDGQGREITAGAGGADRDELIPLLLLADDSESQVRSYYQQGELFVLGAGDGHAMGMTLAIPESNRAPELKAVAVAPELHGRGVGQRMMALVLAELRLAGVQRVTVGTSRSGIGQLAFYQRCGFRLGKIERDFFSLERGYAAGTEENGIPLRDWFGLIKSCSSVQRDASKPQRRTSQLDSASGHLGFRRGWPGAPFSASNKT